MSTGTEDPYVVLAAELGRLGHRLDGMGVELRTLRAQGVAPESQAPDAWPFGQVASGSDATLWSDPAGWSGPPVPPHPDAQVYGGAPGYPRSEDFSEPQAHSRPAAQPPGGWQSDPAQPSGSAPQPSGGGLPPHLAEPDPSPAPKPRTFSALSGARLLAWTGGVVTLLGVVLLLVLAASRGWFSPPARITAGTVLGVALVGVALWLYRRESARIGAVALAATGFATLYLVVVAATTIYDYLDVTPALLLVLLVAAGGLGLAGTWRSELFGGGVVAGAALLTPVLVADWRLVGLVLALQLAALPVVLHRRWPTLALVAAAGPVLYGCVIVAIGDAAGRSATIAVVLGVLVVGLGTAASAARLLPRGPVVVLVAETPVPALVMGIVLGGWGGGALAAAAALGLAGLVALPGTDRLIRLVAAGAAAVALFQATVVALDGASATAVVLGEAIVAAVSAAVLRTRFPMLVGVVYGAFGVLVALSLDAPLNALVQFPALPYVEAGQVHRDALLTGAAVSALVLVLVVALLVAGGRVGLIRPDAASKWRWVPLGFVGLYGATSLVVTLVLVAAPDRAGFTTGHALVTVSWTVGALILLARGISRPALRITGLVLVAAAVAKLVLFDLVALDGFTRVAAFLGAGLVLLAAGARYARLVAEAESARAGSMVVGPTSPTPG
ncbi:MAG: DUF2339 domain-containing protein [Pseudonocardia sp.]